MKPNTIFGLRIAVARLGERILARWWDTAFLDALGFRYLELVYPKTAASAAVVSATEAACRAHDERIGNPCTYKPNLNDGVLITASPLWKLFRLPKWQKDLKACWTAFESEEYEWAHLACTIWPERVKEVCKKDRSIAIAHSLEDLCEVKPPEKKTKRGKKKTNEELNLEAT